MKKKSKCILTVRKDLRVRDTNMLKAGKSNILDTLLNRILRDK